MNAIYCRAITEESSDHHKNLQTAKDALSNVLMGKMFMNPHYEGLERMRLRLSFAKLWTLVEKYPRRSVTDSILRRLLDKTSGFSRRVINYCVLLSISTFFNQQLMHKAGPQSRPLVITITHVIRPSPLFNTSQNKTNLK